MVIRFGEFSIGLLRDSHPVLTSMRPRYESCGILTILQSKPLAPAIDLSAIPRKNLSQAIFLYILIRKARLSGVEASITIVNVRKFNKIYQIIVQFWVYLIGSHSENGRLGRLGICD